MEQFENLARTYTQAPWRKQLQWVVLFALGVVMVALVAGIYLSISARSTAVGRDIHSMQKMIMENDREIEGIQSQKARILSSSQMEARARSLGFDPVPPDQIIYLKIPGYFERNTVTLAPSNERAVVRASAMPPEYTESIFDWLAKNLKVWYRTILTENS